VAGVCGGSQTRTEAVVELVRGNACKQSKVGWQTLGGDRWREIDEDGFKKENSGFYVRFTVPSHHGLIDRHLRCVSSGDAEYSAASRRQGGTSCH
jgi:hypothetical protein